MSTATETFPYQAPIDVWTCPWCAVLTTDGGYDHTCEPGDIAFAVRAKVAREAFEHFMKREEPGTAAEIHSLLAFGRKS